MRIPRVAIVGAGAMGGILAAALARNSADVTLVDVSPELVERITTSGLTVVRGDTEQTLHLPATTDPREVGEVDVVVFLVKSYHTDAAALSATPMVGPETTVLSLQNGWGNGDVLASHFPSDQLAVGVLYHSGTVEAPGRVVHTNSTDPVSFIGPWQGDDVARAAHVAALLESGGLRFEVVSDVRSQVWRKVVLNAAALPTSALTGYVAGALAQDQAMMELVELLAREAARVGVSAGLDIDEDERVETIRTILGGAGTGKASMLQDVEAGRRTEIDVINGAVVRVGEERGIDVIANRAMLALVRGLESARQLG